ncbi:MAG TPA: hypothetical protein VEZ14_07580 [Dehalococcoidia bacterium]|nr:hypothetical protein [Dehalococcoidia bacterium]
MPSQRMIVGLALAAMVAFIVGTLIVSGLRLGGQRQTVASASFCATAEAQITASAGPTAVVAPGQGSSFGDQIPANCRQ